MCVCVGSVGKGVAANPDNLNLILNIHTVK